MKTKTYFEAKFNVCTEFYLHSDIDQKIKID